MAYYNNNEDYTGARDYSDYACEMREEARDRAERYNDWLDDLRAEYLAEVAEYKEHCCHGAACDAEPRDTRQCEECGVYFCADHLFGDHCTACFKVVLAAEETEGPAALLAAMTILTRRAA